MPTPVAPCSSTCSARASSHSTSPFASPTPLKGTRCSSRSSCACWSMRAGCVAITSTGFRWSRCRPSRCHRRSTPSLAPASVPPRIHPVLGPRLDRLNADQRAVIERAAVMGKVFWRGAVSELSIPSARVDLGRHLQTLVSKELVRPARESFVGEDGFRFGHLLIRDAAYGATLKELRTELHEHFADWVERKAGERASEYDELVGYHLEQAYRYLAELGPVDEPGRRLARRGAERLGDAGRKALARGDVPAAVNLLDRVLALLPADAKSRPEFMLELGVALIDVGELVGAAEGLDQAPQRAATGGDRCLVLHAAIERRVLILQPDPASTSEDQINPIKQAIPV